MLELPQCSLFNNHNPCRTIYLFLFSQIAGDRAGSSAGGSSTDHTPSLEHQDAIFGAWRAPKLTLTVPPTKLTVTVPPTIITTDTLYAVAQRPTVLHKVE